MSSIVRQTPSTTTARTAAALPSGYRDKPVDAEGYEGEYEEEDDYDDCYDVIFLNHDGGLWVIWERKEVGREFEIDESCFVRWLTTKVEE